MSNVCSRVTAAVQQHINTLLVLSARTHTHTHTCTRTLPTCTKIINDSLAVRRGNKKPAAA